MTWSKAVWVAALSAAVAFAQSAPAAEYTIDNIASQTFCGPGPCALYATGVANYESRNPMGEFQLGVKPWIFGSFAQHMDPELTKDSPNDSGSGGAATKTDILQGAVVFRGGGVFENYTTVPEVQAGQLISVGRPLDWGVAYQSDFFNLAISQRWAKIMAQGASGIQSFTAPTRAAWELSADMSFGVTIAKKVRLTAGAGYSRAQVPFRTGADASGSTPTYGLALNTIYAGASIFFPIGDIIVLGASVNRIPLYGWRSDDFAGQFATPGNGGAQFGYAGTVGAPTTRAPMDVSPTLIIQNASWGLVATIVPYQLLLLGPSLISFTQIELGWKSDFLNFVPGKFRLSANFFFNIDHGTWNNMVAVINPTFWIFETVGLDVLLSWERVQLYDGLNPSPNAATTTDVRTGSGATPRAIYADGAAAASPGTPTPNLTGNSWSLGFGLKFPL
jgi:hypothetical protein